MKKQKKILRIAIYIETSRAHGRSMLTGIADASQACDNWQLEPVPPDLLKNPDYARRFDGLIVRVMDNETANALVKAGKPVIDTYGRIDDNPLPFIRLDDSGIAKLASNCFAEHRYMRCAYCGFPGIRFSDARGLLFRTFVLERGGTCEVFSGDDGRMLSDSYFRNEKMDEVHDERALRKWVEELPKPIAVFCCNDLRAYHLLRVCAEAHVAVPEEVAVLGVDNDTLLCAFAKPQLSSIDTGAFKAGQTAARMLAEAMGSPGRRPSDVMNRPAGIVERRSTDAYAVNTPWLSDALVYIRRRLGEGISTSDVVAHLGYSHTTVNKVFRAELGSSVQQEIIRQRRERACRLLVETDQTAAAISAECGYPSPQYFAHQFTAHFGMTPERWRRHQRPGP